MEKESLRCLNESHSGSIRKVLQENNTELCVSQENDPELLINLIFSEPVNVKSIYFVSEKELSFDKVSVFLNKVNFSYDIVEQKEDQSFQGLHFGKEFQTQIQVNPVKFQRINSMTIFLTSESNDEIALKYLRVIGKGTEIKRGVV